MSRVCIVDKESNYFKFSYNNPDMDYVPPKGEMVVSLEPPTNFYKPKYDSLNNCWVEGETIETIENIILLREQRKLRQQRETECFPIINRGNLWYNKLTSAQLIELDNWYQSWLNAPETKQIPNKPEWL